MADPAVRTSTLSALKQSCPSAEFLPSASPSLAHAHTHALAHAVTPRYPSSLVAPMDDPFNDDPEWSDEEVLLPKNVPKTKTRYAPPPTNKASPQAVGDMSSESGSLSSDPPSVNGSPLIPPKSASRPDVRAGSTQEDLVQRFYQVTRERDALRKELQRKSMGPHGIPVRGSVVYRSEEATLIEDLQNLRGEIRAWSKEYFSGPPTSRNRPHVHSSKELFGALTDDYTSYLKHANDRPLLVQAFLWSQLQRRVFSNLDKGCGYIWAGKLGDRKLRPINDTLRKAVKNEEQAEEYHRWRALTVNLLVPEVDGRWSPTFDAKPILKWIRRFCGRLRKRLRPWSTISLREGKDQLYTIVSAAVALDLRMKKQRADYRFVTFTGSQPNQFWGYGFYDSEMEDIDEGEERKGRRVQMSLAPALERCGNANGHIFDQNFILVKADVTCRRLEKTRPRNSKKLGTKKNFWSSRS